MLYSLNPMVGVIEGFRWMRCWAPSAGLPDAADLDPLGDVAVLLADRAPLLRARRAPLRRCDLSAATSPSERDGIWQALSRSAASCVGGTLLAEQLADGLTSARSARGATAEASELLGAAGRLLRGRTAARPSGIIGRNGAGKSTLLKLLSRITPPTDGRIELRPGRRLLEVGTGFHPELTGRENVFLNGAILGMQPREIDARFDEIVEFAERRALHRHPGQALLERHVRAAGFSVAAHLEPEILLVDEVLAVGDAEFQRKCLGKMRDLRSRRPDGGLRQPQPDVGGSGCATGLCWSRTARSPPKARFLR